MTKPKKAVRKADPPRIVSEPDIEMGRRVRLRRVELDISQVELGEKLGVSFQQVQKYEKGVNRISATRINKIAEVLQVDPSFFYKRANQETKEIQSLLFTDSTFSLRLLRCYARVKDTGVQHAFVNLMETFADSIGK